MSNSSPQKPDRNLIAAMDMDIEDVTRAVLLKIGFRPGDSVLVNRNGGMVAIDVNTLLKPKT